MNTPSSSGSAVASNVARDRADFPLTDMQRLLVVSASDGMEYALLPHLYFEVERPGLDIDRFASAIARVLERHRRNIVVVTQDLRLRQVDEVTPPPVSVWDLRGHSELGTMLGLMRIRHRMSNQSLPMDRWPWLDFQVTRYGVDQARLHVNFSNLFFDQVSGLRLIAEIERDYASPGAEHAGADEISIEAISTALTQR
ncbi:MAG: hypothetical protein IT473_07730, partial [Lysobacter sp.]|nr:hypothetical protein [Lysobacter sp.]